MGAMIGKIVEMLVDKMNTVVVWSTMVWVIVSHLEAQEVDEICLVLPVFGMNEKIFQFKKFTHYQRYFFS